MGYRPQRTTYKLRFEQYPGLKITMRSTSLGVLQEVMSTNIEDVRKANEIQQKFFSTIIGLIESWNVEHPDVDDETNVCPVCSLEEGTPLPVNVTSVYCLDLEFFLAIVMAWGTAVSRVSRPKEPNLSNGERIPKELTEQLAELQSPLI